ncbi:MAG: AbrB/MazE/SpoVT family DNA-binding domain-containing protein [Puniceicoccaceae bacterium]|nr:MAG: AbrB/MazE/SpoVT family DNA-binding domain-containing protein [Puniceicoccaceae bacterium]
MKKAKLFRNGGSYAVRIPKSWVPVSGEVFLRREGKRIVMTEAGEDLRSLAHRFAEDGLVDFERSTQPRTPRARKL